MTKPLTVGDVVDDGTIFAGVSPDTSKPMYTAPADVSPCMTFRGAAKYARELSRKTGEAYRVPSENELNVLFQNKERGALKGTFNLTGTRPDGSYRSSTPYIDYNGYDARCQRFSDGARYNYCQFLNRSVRLVRG